MPPIVNDPSGNVNPGNSASQAAAYLQAMLDSMATSLKSQTQGYKDLLKFSQEFAKISQEVFGKFEVRATETSAATGKVVQSLDDFLKAADKIGKIDKTLGAAMLRDKMADYRKRIVAEGGLSDANKAAIIKLREHQKTLDKTTGSKALTDIFTSQLPGMTSLISAFSKMTPGALIVSGLAEVFKQLWQYGNNAAKAVNLYTMEGGILNDSLARSSVTTKNFYSVFVDTSEAMSTASAILGNYGGTIAHTAADQDRLTEELAHTSVYLSKMGPMFGMTGEQLGQTMGQLSARFHMSMKQLMPAFEGTARLAMGLGISTTDLTNVLIKSGDTMRYFSGKDGLGPLMKNFSALGNQMVSVSARTNTFWSNLRPGEFIDMMQKVTDLWSKTGAETYIAMKAGAAPTTMAGLAGGIEEFYTKGPVEALRTIATGYTEKLEAAGMTQRQAFLMLSRTGPFAELGRAAMPMLEALTSMTEEQLRSTGTAGDMNAFLKAMADRFPAQAKDLEQLRETQALMEDPMKVIARTIQKILTHIISIAGSPLLRGAGWAARVFGEVGGEPSPAKQSIDRPRGI